MQSWNNKKLKQYKPSALHSNKNEKISHLSSMLSSYIFWRLQHSFDSTTWHCTSYTKFSYPKKNILLSTREYSFIICVLDPCLCIDLKRESAFCVGFQKQINIETKLCKNAIFSTNLMIRIHILQMSVWITYSEKSFATYLQSIRWIFGSVALNLNSLSSKNVISESIFNNSVYSDNKKYILNSHK